MSILQGGVLMPRIARVVAVGYPHHITQRGNYGQDVFIDEEDRENKEIEEIVRHRDQKWARIMQAWKF